jgi:methyl-accepting chemotaxis protein
MTRNKGDIDMAAQKYRRRNYFIKKRFQTKFILRFCALVVLGSVISGVILYLLSRGTVTTAFVNSRLSIVNTADYILPALIGSGLVSIVLISIATAIVVMYLSHRIAGPLFRIEKSAEEIGSGNLAFKIWLRSTDEITRMADGLNKMTENLRKSLLEIKSQSDDLGKRMDSLIALCRNKPSLPQEIQDALEALNTKKSELNKAIDHFKLSEE